jgi:hypothetical protein
MRPSRPARSTSVTAFVPLAFSHRGVRPALLDPRPDQSSPESACAHPNVSVLLRRPLAPGRCHLQKGLLLLLGFGFARQTEKLLGDATILVGCAHDTLHGHCYRAEKVGYMKLLDDGGIKPFGTLPVVTSGAKAVN